MSTIEIYGDGGSRGNPGPAASGVAIFLDGKKIHESSHYLGVTTNNVAEYTSVIKALEWMVENKNNFIGKVVFWMDSELVVRQLSGIYKIKSLHLIPMSVKVKELLTKLSSSVTFMSVPRSKNSLADGLVNKELDLQLKKS